MILARIRRRFRSRGVSLLQVMVAASLMASLGLGMLQLMGGLNRNIASLGQRGEYQEVRDMIRRRLSCRQSFPTNTCAVGPGGQVLLRDVYGNLLFTDYDTSADPTKALFVGSYKFSNTSVRLRVSCGAGSVHIRIANWLRPDKGWPTAPTIETCQEVLGGTFTNMCPGTMKMVGLNKDTLEPICVPNNLECPVGQYLKGIDFNASGSPIPLCRTLPSACADANSVLQGYTFDGLGNAIPTCTPLLPRVVALEDKTNRMTSRNCHRIRDNTYVSADNPKTPIRGFQTDGEPLCAAVPGDYDGDNYADIVVGASGVGGNGHIKVLSGAAARTNTVSELASFYSHPLYAGGIHAGLMDISGDGFADILSGSEQNAHVKIFMGPGVSEGFSNLIFPGFLGGITVGP